MKSDRVLIIAFSVSLGVHLVLLIGQLVSLSWLQAPKIRLPLNVIYEYEIAEKELKTLQRELARAKRDALATPTAASVGERTLVRIPDRPTLSTQSDLTTLAAERGSIVDLTNLVDASQGDPILLSYFSAIREQIQRTANRQMWMTGSGQEGLIYISFLLNANGMVDRVEIVSDRSVPGDQLRDIALRIVKTAAPFPPFPPSISEPSKTIVVPLEFLVGR